MENVAIAYWTDSVPGTEGLVGKMNAALCKMIRTIDAASCISVDERKNLKGPLEIYPKSVVAQI